MKIGIITYHRAKNLGAMLQSYALQRIINKYKGKCEIIDYRNDEMEESYRVKKFKEVHTLKDKIKNFLFMKKNKEFEYIREEFNTKFQKVSKEIYNKQNILDANRKYDIFVTGSDQVWNFKLNYNDKNYFLHFVTDNKKKNSYAASFGTSELKKKDAEEIKDELKTFNNISVRENSGSNIVKELVGCNCPVVLDPTLLLNKEDWNKLIINERLEKDKYIFVYIIAYTPTLLKFARELARKRKCKLICFHTSYQHYWGMRNLVKVSPMDFLNYIKNAEAIVTSSFHGLCFSINFQKEFYYELDNNIINNNSRLITLSQKLGLEDREIINGRCKGNEKISYESIEEKLKQERKKSIDYILKMGDDNGRR